MLPSISSGRKKNIRIEDIKAESWDEQERETRIQGNYSMGGMAQVQSAHWVALFYSFMPTALFPVAAQAREILVNSENSDY